MLLISILTLLNYDPTLFDNVKFPAGVDKSAAIKAICFNCAELSVLYSQPSTLKEMLSLWGLKNAYRWETLYKTTQQTYNPIENYDRQEDFTDEQTSENHVIAGGTEKLKAFESGELTDSSSASSKNDGNGTLHGTRKGRIHGNVGVTTTQQMLEEERRIADFNIYDTIAEDFKKDFCVMVY